MNVKTDNSLMAYLNKYEGCDIGKDNVPSLNIQDIALNWKKKETVSVANRVAAVTKKIEEYQKFGFNNDDMTEILLSEGFAHNDIAAALPKIAKKQETATKYDDVKDNIYNLAYQLEPKAFVDLITANHNPRVGIVRIASNHQHDFLRLINDFKYYGPSSPVAKELDDIVEPFISEEFERTALMTVSKQNHVKCGSTTHKGIFKIKDEDNIYTVDLNKKLCTCSRFDNGNFAEIGIPCEHITLVERISSPKRYIEEAEKIAKRRM
jgi:hypothetical protein